MDVDQLAQVDADGSVSPPVAPSVVLDLDADWQTTLVIDTCVTGPLSVPADGTTLTIVDSIVDGVADGLGRAAEQQQRAENGCADGACEGVHVGCLSAGRCRHNSREGAVSRSPRSDRDRGRAQTHRRPDAVSVKPHDRGTGSG